MNIYDYPAFAKILSDFKPIVFLCGAGLSISLTDNSENQAKGWVKWLREGVKYLPGVGSGANSLYSKRLEAKFGSFSAAELIDAAGYMLDELKTEYSYTEFMNSTIGSLEISNDKLSNALGLLARSGDIFATTNYDRLIEKAVGMDYLTYSTPGKILQMLSDNSEARVSGFVSENKGTNDDINTSATQTKSIIHLHGVYDSAAGIDDIIANQVQYEAVLKNQGAQFIQNLLSTHALVILGCGSTVDDPNLSGLLSFAGKQLGLDVPYFYLHKAGDDTSALGENVTTVCYGPSYSDLTDAVNDIANLRIRTRYRNTGLIKVNPYIVNIKSGKVSYRLHYLDEFSRFVGREKELAALNRFRCIGDKIQWWAMIGEGGIGKSRLAFEWLKELPNDWFGFFAYTDKGSEAYCCFSPFSNTVIVMDYIVGHEAGVAAILSVLRQRFEYSRYKLRILMIERRYDKEKHYWVDDIFKAMDMQDRMAYESYLYHDDFSVRENDPHNGKTLHKYGNPKNGELVPLHVKTLAYKEELAVIESYMQTYLDMVADDTMREKYLNGTTSPTDFSTEILKGFHESLAEEYSRPLFLAIYTELWIYKGGNVDVDGLSGILEAFLQKEEERWIICLDGSMALLNGYVKLLALAAATDFICLDDEQGYYQNANDNLKAFLETDRLPGTKQKDYSDLFIRQEYAHDYSSIEHKNIKSDVDIAIYQGEVRRIGEDNKYLILDENGQPNQLTAIEAKYPDIIREFLVDYYIPEHEWIPFAQAARLGSVMRFDTFLSRAIEDFPDFRSFVEMEFAPLEDECDRLGRTIFYLLEVRELSRLGRMQQVADDLCTSKAEGSVLLYEMEAWRRIGIVLTDDGKLNELFEVGLKSANYVIARCGDKNVRESFPNIMESFLIGLHNDERPKQMAELLAKYEVVADKVIEDDSIATCFVKNYIRLAVLWMRAKDRKQTYACWAELMKFWERFPKDTDNLKLIAESTENFYDYYNENNIPERRIRLVRDLERIFDETKKDGIPNVDMANALAIHEANEHSLNYKQLGMGSKRETWFFRSDMSLAGVFTSTNATDANARARMKSAEQRIDELYGLFPDEEEVVLGYAYLLYFRNTFGRTWHAKIDDSVLTLFQDWIIKYLGKALQLNEFYAQILLEKWMDACDFDDRQEANRLYNELVGIAIKLDKQFPDVENQVRDVLNSGFVRKL